MRLPPVPLERSDVLAILDACGRRGLAGPRSRAHLALLYRTGIRVAESCSVELGDVTLDASGTGRVRVLRPKGVERGTPPRELGLDRGAVAALAPWLEARAKIRRPGPWLFLTRSGGPVLPSQVRQTLRAMARRAGIRRRVHPHALRHTFAREIYFEGAGLAEIMVALGHRRLGTTQLYLRSIGATEVIARTQGRDW